MDLLEKVKEAGIIGAGGAGFPTHAKLSAKAEYILLNGAECEPLLRVDQQLMELYAQQIIQGFEAAGRYVGAQKAIIGIKYKHKKVIEILNNKIIELGLQDYVSVGELPDIYPAGDEQVLVYQLTGRVVPEVSIPLKVGCVVVNSETALNIYNAINDTPVTDTYITVAGDVKKPITVKVPVGMPIIDVLKLSGVENINEYSVIDGGPMMGKVMGDEAINGYITKKSKGYILLKKDHFLMQKKSRDLSQAKRISKAACEQCRMCTDMCPRYLLGHNMQPHKIMRSLAYDMQDVSQQQIAQLCSECGACELFSCPANLYPKSMNILYKQKLMEQGVRYSSEKTDFEARPARENRLIPTKRLIIKLGLSAFDKDAPICFDEFMPSKVCIATSQHIGAPAKPVVCVGDKVEKGQLIGDIPEKSLGATIHASISGAVEQVDDKFIVIKAD